MSQQMGRDEALRELEQLTDTVASLQDSIRHLTSDVAELEGERDALWDRVNDLEAENDRLHQRIDDLEQQLDIVDASVPAQQTTRVRNIVRIIEYAYEHGTGGTGGVSLDTGECTAAIDGSRDTALRLMDDIGGAFRWAESETPGGPNPKQLRIATKRHDQPDLLDDVTARYGGGDEVE